MSYTYLAAMEHGKPPLNKNKFFLLGKETERTKPLRPEGLQVAQKIIRHIESRGGEFAQWYIGITSDVKLRLFTTHNLGDHNEWTYENAKTQPAAEEIVKHIIEKYKTHGGFGGGDGSATYVYAYKITPRTIQ